MTRLSAQPDMSYNSLLVVDHGCLNLCQIHVHRNFSYFMAAPLGLPELASLADPAVAVACGEKQLHWPRPRDGQTVCSG